MKTAHDGETDNTISHGQTRRKKARALTAFIAAFLNVIIKTTI